MSGIFYISPDSSSAGSENASPVNLKPTINKKLMRLTSTRRRGFPNGTFSKRNNRNTLNSRQWGNTPFFTNAKPASMLERGWVRSRDNLHLGHKGLLTLKDGPEFHVKIVKKQLKLIEGTVRFIYSFETNDKKVIDLDSKDRHEDWDFYTATNPVAFVPRKGGRKTRRKA
jgi:hypothetical protein